MYSLTATIGKSGRRIVVSMCPNFARLTVSVKNMKTDRDEATKKEGERAKGKRREENGRALSTD